MEINSYSEPFAMYKNNKSDFINKLKQDNIEYRSLPNEKIETAVYKANNKYFADEVKIDNFLQNRRQYNVSEYFLDMYV